MGRPRTGWTQMVKENIIRGGLL